MSPLVILSTFLASAVEWVEAFTIVLAVGLYRGWRAALAGTAFAAAALAVIVIAVGAAVDSFPVADAQVVVGVFLLLFGLRWLHKAILRAAGLKALHDEAEEFEATQAKLSTREHWVAVSTAFNGVLLEGVEVVLIVIALGGVGHRVGAAVGAVIALAAVIVLGVAVRAPLTRVPENLMKASVGVMLSSFGSFFVGEGIGVHWWHSDVSIVLLVALYAALFVGFSQLLRRPVGVPVPGVVRAVVTEIWGLVVGAGSLALAAIAAVLGAALLA
ncbi:MAG: hypothetical protein WAU41_04085, partial [Gaiellaceae bacterium]